MLDGGFGGVIAGCFFVRERSGGRAEDQGHGGTVREGDAAGTGEGGTEGVFGVD